MALVNYSDSDSNNNSDDNIPIKKKRKLNNNDIKIIKSIANNNDINRNKKRKKYKLKLKSNKIKSNHDIKPQFLESKLNEDKTKKNRLKLINKMNKISCINNNNNNDNKIDDTKNIETINNHEIIKYNEYIKQKILNDNKKSQKKTAKERAKIQRLRGQSSQNGWKSETFMKLRQYYD